eukprot:Plantae.Rhodophyta-Purpureofilum_apyrenoidigerum.ctg14320.p1 GENE.Plantae.Rhodophyta-Purpureofilum_apyrenoidigerum.ctg14320~~Plantae.Rhodophyta-Purpureofilum_apyrenoidigerum.ctg14320.p1  ORF type:complete len:429 (+),score=130.61 Plantae.Rhodophyta-Purpureofilum_apyrenoidigerum.ctg14320:95-1288(+)
MEDEEVDSEQKSVESPEVVNKYRTAAEIADKAMAAVCAELKPGKKIVELCTLGDKVITDSTAGVFSKAKTDKGEKIEKGIAFPTCISLNNCVCHFSPFPDDPTELAEGDIVSVDLGCHIDGYIALTAKSVVVGNDELTGKAADAIMAAYVAAEAVLRVMRPGKTNYDVTEIINRAANQFKCEVVEGSISHQMKRYVIDGNKAIIGKPTYEYRVDNVTFENNEVYGIDIAISTGEGKIREQDVRETIYKRQVDVEYMLKLKASRKILSEINSKSPALPFTLRAFSEDQSIRFGMSELINHNLVVGYPVLFERNGEIVGRIKFTALLMPSQTIRITTVEKPAAKSEIEVTDKVLKDLLAQEVETKKKKKKKKKGPGEANESEAPAADDGENNAAEKMEM